jgi:D-glycero-D-manno-heptose 1,7-bisphosphate phosphatase
VDAVYFCPEVPVDDDRSIVEHGDRKPGAGMLIRAAEELNLDLGASWMVGDMISDILAGINACCRGSILVRTGKGLTDAEAALDVPYQVADDLLAASDLIPASPKPTDDGNGAGCVRTGSSHTLREPV